MPKGYPEKSAALKTRGVHNLVMTKEYVFIVFTVYLRKSPIFAFEHLQKKFYGQDKTMQCKQRIMKLCVHSTSGVMFVL